MRPDVYVLRIHGLLVIVAFMNTYLSFFIVEITIFTDFLVCSFLSIVLLFGVLEIPSRCLLVRLIAYIQLKNAIGRANDFRGAGGCHENAY